MRSWRLAIIIALLTLPGLLAAAPVALDYSPTTRTIRACQLLIPAAPSNANSYVLPLLARATLKPAGWTFVNPQAPSLITDSIWSRWLNPTHNPDARDRASWRSGAGYWGGRGIAAGSPLRATVPPETPQYWELELTDETAEQLIQYDLIYIASAQSLDVISPYQQAGLRRAVENGAVLWVDFAGGLVTNFPVPRSNDPRPFNFGTLPGTFVARAPATQQHALLSYPHRLSLDEIRQLGEYPNGPGLPGVPAYAVAVSGLNDVVLSPVVNVSTGSGNGPGIVAARYGDGAVVVTAEGVGQDIEEWYGAGLAEPNEYQRPDLKLGYNIANYAYAVGHAAGSPSGRAVEFAPARPPLDLIWQFPPPWGDPTLPSQPGPVAGSPVVHGGYVYALSAYGPGNRRPTLWCLEPGTFSNGYRLIWSQALPNGYTPRATSPALTTLRIAGLDVPVVLVTAVHAANGGGQLLAYNATNGNALWNVALAGYVGTAQVVDLSTPVVYKDWVFVLSTERDTSFGADIQSAYGRVWAIRPGPAGPAVAWVYPHTARTEMQKLLPPTHDPVWVADPNRSEFPPEGDVRPALTTAPRNPLGLPVEVALVVGAPARMVWANPNINTAPGYTEYCLVPTPTMGAAGGPALLNPDYYSVPLTNTGVTSVDAAERDDGTGTPPGVAVANAPFTFAGVNFARFNNVGGAGGVLEFLATPSETPQADGYDNPLVLRRGCRVNLDYRVGGPSYTDETHYLPGPLAWNNASEAVGAHTTEHSGRTLSSGQGLAVLDTETGRSQVRWQPGSDSPLIAPSYTSLATPAQEAETAYVASNARTGTTNEQEWTGVVHGVRTPSDLVVHLGPGIPDNITIAMGTGVTVRSLATGAPLASSSYDLDYVTRTLRFRPEAGPFVGGKALIFTWTDSNGADHNELHVGPRLARFEYVGGFIRLRNYPVVNSTVSVRLSDGTPVAGVVPGEPLPLATYDLRGAGAEEVLSNGWLDFRDATVTDNQGNVLPLTGRALGGREVLISYVGWSEPEYAAVTITDEQQQIPVGLGFTRSGVAVAGQTVTVGSMGAANDLGEWLVPFGAESEYQTLVSMVWDPISHLVKGAAARAAYSDPAAAPLVPGVLSAPTSAGGRLYVGSAGLSAPLTFAEPGWVGCLAPRRTIICDGNRLVETTGADRTLVLTGSQALVYGRSAPEPTLARPFSRPAKAAALSNGAFLVVDTGNNRVIVVDRAGNQLWPLDEYGYDYYSSPSRADGSVPGGVAGNYNLKLSQPADAYRYTDSTGLVHTIIADTGHNRVLEVLTTNLTQGGQQHQVVELTPSHVRPAWDPTHRLALRYVRAQPIFDFGSGNVIGYLCAAANVDRVVVVEAGTKLVNPDPNTIAPGGTRPWSDWFAIYDAVNGPRFPNLRHVEYFRYGDRIYVLVVAGGLDAGNQDGVWMWEIDTNTGPVAGPGPHGATWEYTAGTYVGTTGAFGVVVTPTTTYQKRFYPVCAKVLFPGPQCGGNILITNYTGVTENLARENVGSPGTALYGEVFEVGTDHSLQTQRLIPDPFAADWNDPLNQPSYAERY